MITTQRPAPGSRGRVVLAEDDGDIRRWLAKVLNVQGYDVVELSCGGDLMRQVLTYPFGSLRQGDIVVSDVRMPKQSGVDVLLEVQRRRLGVPVVLMTAHADRINRALALAGGAVALLEKPFNADTLVELLERVAEPSSAHRAAPVSDFPPMDTQVFDEDSSDSSN